MTSTEKYAKIRDKNTQEHIRRFNYVMDNFEDIKEFILIRRKLQSNFDLTLTSERAFDEYTKNIRELNGKIKQLLEHHNLPSDYLEPIYNCPVCEDKGFYYENYIYPRKCKCNSEGGFSFSFEDFDVELFSKEKKEGYKVSPYEHMKNVLNYAKSYCDAFPENKKPHIILYGASGLGKSFLATCICNEISKKGFSAIKVNAYKLMDEFKEKHVHDVSYSNDYYGCDLLVIDDIGTEPMYKNITVEYLFSLINERIENRLSTIFITNLSFENCCDRYDERLASRMFDSTYTDKIMLYGDNLRLRK